jgi:hypothetical protein
LVEPRKNAAGRFFYSLAGLGLPVPVRDVRGFWTSIMRQGLAGSLDRPVAARLSVHPLAEARKAIRELIEA